MPRALCFRTVSGVFHSTYRFTVFSSVFFSFVSCVLVFLSPVFFVFVFLLFFFSPSFFRFVAFLVFSVGSFCCPFVWCFPVFRPPFSCRFPPSFRFSFPVLLKKQGALWARPQLSRAFGPGRSLQAESGPRFRGVGRRSLSEEALVPRIPFRLYSKGVRACEMGLGPRRAKLTSRERFDAACDSFVALIALERGSGFVQEIEKRRRGRRQGPRVPDRAGAASRGYSGASGQQVPPEVELPSSRFHQLPSSSFHQPSGEFEARGSFGWVFCESQPSASSSDFASMLKLPLRELGRRAPNLLRAALLLRHSHFAGASDQRLAGQGRNSKGDGPPKKAKRAGQKKRVAPADSAALEAHRASRRVALREPPVETRVFFSVAPPDGAIWSDLAWPILVAVTVGAVGARLVMCHEASPMSRRPRSAHRWINGPAAGGLRRPGAGARTGGTAWRRGIRYPQGGGC